MITQIVLFFISILLIIIKIKIFIAQIILFFIVILLVILKIKIFKIFHHIQYNWVTQDPLSWGDDIGPKTIESCLRLKIRLSGPLPWPKCVGSPQATPITKLGCVHAQHQVGMRPRPPLSWVLTRPHPIPSWVLKRPCPTSSWVFSYKTLWIATNHYIQSLSC